MTKQDHGCLNHSLPRPVLNLEELEQRLEMQGLEACPSDTSLCIWFGCTDVCPPNG
jgi:hypothetical protein